MSGQWKGSTRRQQLPSNWASIRRRILERDGGQCTWTDETGRCWNTATDVDHITPGDDHSDTNLRSLCPHHHRKKTAQEGVAARPTRHRPPDVHPGLITDGGG